MRLFLAVLAGFGALVGAWLFLGGTERSVDMQAHAPDVTRGAYLIRLAGCVSCHTKPDGGVFLAGGPPLITPFGTFHGPNITPDPTHGLGNWSAQDFAEAMVNGHSAKTGALYPVFPFTSYSKMTSSDLADLWAYLRSVAPAATASRPHEISNPFLVRPLMGPWKTLFHKPEAFTDDPAHSAAWNRGRYIVDGIGHCAECHTPRGPLGALDEERALEGSVLPPKGEKVPAITAAALTKRGYKKADLVMAFRFGLVPDGDVLGGRMGEVLDDQLQHLTAEDLDAIATYLLTP